MANIKFNCLLGCYLPFIVDADEFSKNEKLLKVQDLEKQVLLHQLIKVYLHVVSLSGIHVYANKNFFRSVGFMVHGSVNCEK